MTRILLVGESWTTHMIHQKGFDSFTSTEYVEGGREFKAALSTGGHEVVHVPAHRVEFDFPRDLESISRFGVVVISDVGTNTFLLTRRVFGNSQSEPNRLELLREYVLAGGGLLMVGGYLSFSGIDGKARYGASPLSDLLPVSLLEVDDREERPEGARIDVLEQGHPALGGVGNQWPSVLGFNRTKKREDCPVLVTVNGHPLIAVREAGLGRSSVFTSDMSPHWAPTSFVDWAGYGPLWRALVTWTASE